MQGYTVLSPVGVNLVERQAISQRVPSLDGLRVGLINNNKPNSHLLQEHIVDLIRKQFQIQDVVLLQKPNPAVPAVGLADWAKEVDVVITAMGD
jgi:hypothetical protein